jgi:hypothetical protein
MKPVRPPSDDEIIATLREIEVPEPSPLFWDHFSERVHTAVSAEPPPSVSWMSRINFAWAGGLVAGLAVAVAVTMSVRQRPVPVEPVAPVAAVAGEATLASNAAASIQDDASWAVMGELASELDFDQAGVAGLTVAPGTAEDALTQLTGDEQRAVVELLQQELKHSKTL